MKGQDMGTTRCCIFPAEVFFVLSKINEAGNYTIVYRSEAVPVMGENVIWMPATLSMRSLCNGDKDRGLQIQFFQVGFNGYHSSLGFLYTTVNKLKALGSRCDSDNGGGEPVRLVGKNGTVSPFLLFLFLFKYKFFFWQDKYFHHHLLEPIFCTNNYFVLRQMDIVSNVKLQLCANEFVFYRAMSRYTIMYISSFH